MGQAALTRPTWRKTCVPNSTAELLRRDWQLCCRIGKQRRPPNAARRRTEHQFLSRGPDYRGQGAGSVNVRYQLDLPREHGPHIPGTPPPASCIYPTAPPSTSANSRSRCPFDRGRAHCLAGGTPSRDSALFYHDPVACPKWRPLLRCPTICTTSSNIGHPPTAPPSTRGCTRPSNAKHSGADASPTGTWCVPIGAGEVAVVDHIGRTAKVVFERRVRVVDSQVVMDVNNALFKILSTN